MAEGAKPAGYSEDCQKKKASIVLVIRFWEGLENFWRSEISQLTKIETRSITLSHLQRGGVPCAYDRRMGRYFGIAAVDLIVKEDFGKMVSYRNGRITAVPLREAIGRLNLVDVQTQYDTERYNGRRTILGSNKLRNCGSRNVELNFKLIRFTRQSAFCIPHSDLRSRLVFFLHATIHDDL